MPAGPSFYNNAYRWVIMTGFRAATAIWPDVLRMIVFGGMVALTLFWACGVQAAQNSSNDPCISFLSSGFTDGSFSQEGRYDAGDTSAAGKAATISLLLGVRLALGPTEDLTGRHDAQASAPGISALDVQRYRTCKKEHALRVSYLP